MKKSVSECRQGDNILICSLSFLQTCKNRRRDITVGLYMFGPVFQKFVRNVFHSAIYSGSYTRDACRDACTSSFQCPLFFITFVQKLDCGQRCEQLMVKLATNFHENSPSSSQVLMRRLKDRNNWRVFLNLVGNGPKALVMSQQHWVRKGDTGRSLVWL